jgi:deoxycytidylate deaminase
MGVFTGAKILARRHTQVGDMTKIEAQVNAEGVSMDTGEIDKPEMIFALVGPAGVRLSDVSKVLIECLKSFGYTAEIIRVSKLLENYHDYDKHKIVNGEVERILYCQGVALDFRRKLEDGAAPMLAAITEIRKRRAEITGNPEGPRNSHVFILDQLKHPSEVELMRKIYGPSFMLLAGHAPKTKRISDLAKRLSPDSTKSGEAFYIGKAGEIIEIDDNQVDDPDFGQNTRDTYPLADFFIDLTNEGGEYAARRFINLLFGHPFDTPYPNEYAMHQAWSASLRSSDFNRQVGAVIVKEEKIKSSLQGDLTIVATGMNEVPFRGGGLYWRDTSPDARDQCLDEKGDNRANAIKMSALEELLERIKSIGWLNKDKTEKPPKDLAIELLPSLKRTQFINIGEFSRPVHAEMAALIDSARRGVAVQGLCMYVSTFPCHNCAKHIIAAGLKQVIYLEPYPKSKAKELYGEEIMSKEWGGQTNQDMVEFIAYTGIAPRQYQRLFSMENRGKKRGISKKEWEEKMSSLLPIYVMKNASASYLLNERKELKRLPESVYKWDKKTLCPD